MPFEKIVLRPGVNVEATPLLNEASWSVSNLVRFFQGMLQKLGGWSRLTSTALIGTCRGLLPWADLSGNSYVAAGTEQRLQVVSLGVVYDITPITKTDNLSMPFQSFSGTGNAYVNDTSNGANVGDWIYIDNPASIGGLVLRGFYQVTAINTVNQYEISVLPLKFTSSVSSGGAAAEFTTSNGMNTVTVTLDNHGLSAGDNYTIYISTTVGGLTLVGVQLVVSVIDANNFTFAAATGATSTASAFENGGDIRVEYLLPNGLVSAGVAEGYGEGAYGAGPYGVGAPSGTPTPLRQWSLDSWGEQLLASPTQGSLYFWDPTDGLPGSPAQVISQAPPAINGFFIAMPEQQVVAYGTTNPNTSLFDPMLIQWCDVADYTDWTATAANQAGSFRLPRGSKIVGGIQGPQYGLLWTDLSLWAMQYIQPPLVYGFTEIAAGCGLIAQRAQCILGTTVPWMSYNGFFTFSGGGMTPLPCSVWDVIFGNINSSEQDKICMGGNSHFNEFFLFYPSLSGNGENDSYVKYQMNDGVWDYGSLIRTAWYDQSIITGNNPLGVDGNMLIQQHESSPDADGQPLISTATSGWFKLNDGQLYIFIERLIPDFILQGGATVQISVITADYPEDTPTVYGPYNVTGNSSSDYIIVRSRSRFARIQISSTADLGSFWRLGEMIYMATPAGRR